LLLFSKDRQQQELDSRVKEASHGLGQLQQQVEAAQEEKQQLQAALAAHAQAAASMEAQLSGDRAELQR
jgi:septal ring factor EnvC (AmiA/AmiB activator)